MFDNFWELSSEAADGGFQGVAFEDEGDGNTKPVHDNDEIPLLALKNTVLFPGIVIPITVGRDKSTVAVHQVHRNNGMIGVLSQKNQQIDDPKEDDLYHVGTLARIVKILKMPDGSITAVLQGKSRFKLEKIVADEPYLKGQVIHLHNIGPTDNRKFEAAITSVRGISEKIVQLNPQIPTEAVMMLKNIDDNEFLLDFIASNMNAPVKTKQEILETGEQLTKATKLIKHLTNELQLLELRDQIESKVRGNMEQQQREYFLNQQLKTIQEELGQSPQASDVQDLKSKAEKKNWPESVAKAYDKNLQKLERSNPQMADYGVTLNYLETLVELPWGEYTEDKFDLKKVKSKLDKDHFGLEKVKDRILEHLAVLKLKGDLKSPIICLVGPPGVGKTSLGRSIAEALGRKFVRMSLGGLHDESEIRGHRKTYIGAMPGRIIQSLKKAETSNPVFVLDEIDKLGRDFRGDPSSALLEVLDPEQNENFYDNFLELEYDLSKILFIATANSLNGIQKPLLDRMEIIDVSGYSSEEKFEIAKKHLIPNQREKHGLKASQITVQPGALKYAIKHYTRESGVRSLDRVIAKFMRYAAKEIAYEAHKKVSITAKNLNDVLGPEKYQRDVTIKTKIPGIAIGLAWTAVGGDILFIEASTSKGTGKLTVTGNLGDVMKESVSAALSYLKANQVKHGLQDVEFSKLDIHIHVPEGAIPKDGPSAGITMTTALFSALSERMVKGKLAMTGEITLRGKVLPVGGIKEKVLAAKRAGIEEVVLCKDNMRDFKEIPEDYIKGLRVHYVEEMSEVLKAAFS